MTTFTLGVFHIFRVPYNTTLFWSHFNSFLKYTSLEDDIEDHATQTNRTEARKKYPQCYALARVRYPFEL